MIFDILYVCVWIQLRDIVVFNILSVSFPQLRNPSLFNILCGAFTAIEEQLCIQHTVCVFPVYLRLRNPMYSTYCTIQREA